MEKKEMVEKLKKKVKEYGQGCHWKGCVDTMAQTRKAMQKEDDFKYYEGQAKKIEENLNTMFDIINRMIDIVTERK